MLETISGGENELSFSAQVLGEKNRESNSAKENTTFITK